MRQDSTPTAAPEGDFMPPALRPPRSKPEPIPLPDRAAVEAAAAIRDARSKRTIQRHERQRKACDEARADGFNAGQRAGYSLGLHDGQQRGHVRGWRQGAVQAGIAVALFLLLVYMVAGNLGRTVITGPLS